MRSAKKTVLAVSLALALAAALIPMSPRAEAAYTPPYTTVRIGIYTYNSSGSPSEKTFTSSNLQSVPGCGYGYRLGYFDDNRDFVDIGASITDTDEITVTMDKNMVYNADSRRYVPLEEGSGGVVLGCFHLTAATGIMDFASASAMAAQYPDGFVRYENGSFTVLKGQYTSSADARDAASAEGLSVDSGTAYTVTVVETGTNRILFEFDCGTERSIGIMPIAPEGVKAQTYHRDCQYYGGFSFLRKTGDKLTTVNYVNVEDYVKGVVPWEMSASWPLEALKAQAITARTYLMANLTKHKTLGFDICNTAECQAYHGNSRANANSDMAVDQTAGQYLTYQGELCETYYTSSDGGATENSENVWTATIPYLRGVVDPYEKDIESIPSQYHYTVSYTPSQLAQRLRDRGSNCSDIASIRMTFTDVGNVKSITFTDTRGRNFTFSKSDTRGVTGCRSQRFTVNGLGPVQSAGYCVNGQTVDSLSGLYAVGSGGVDVLPSGDLYVITGQGEIGKLGDGGVGVNDSVGPDASGKFVFSGTGWGHNVGMSQWGAYSMALNYGMTCEEILRFYYTGTEVTSTGLIY